jgi:flagellar hook-length control protein FliK
VYGVTSEATASASFQTAPVKPARADQSQGNDRFAALVDSSIPADTGGDRASTAQQPSVSQRRADDASATSDNARSRDVPSSTDRGPKNASDDRNASAKQDSSANAGADPHTNSDAVQRSKAKSSGDKADAAKTTNNKPTDKRSSDAASGTNPVASDQQAGPSATTPNAVAVAIPVTIVSTDIPVARPASGNATAPLAIAAAAIAASSAANSAPVAESAQVKTDSGGKAIPTASVAAADAASILATSNAAAGAGAKIAVPAAASEAVAAPVKQPATQDIATAATDAALTAAAAATAPVAPKPTLVKDPVSAQGMAAASGNPDSNSVTSDASVTATQSAAAHSNGVQSPALADKQQTGNDIIPAKADAFPASSSRAAPAPHDHSSTPATAHALTDVPGAGLQATATIQQQLPSAAAAPVGPLGVTAAANAPAPLSGLAVEIAASVRSGKSRFEIRLDPADLGRIDVRIDVDRNGQVTSHLTVEKPETLSMLRQDAPQLQRALDDAGFKTGGGGLQFSLRDQSSSGQNNGNETGRNAQRLVISDEDAIPAAVAGRTYGRVLGASSGVDIKV